MFLCSGLEKSRKATEPSRSIVLSMQREVPNVWIMTMIWGVVAGDTVLQLVIKGILDDVLIPRKCCRLKSCSRAL